MTASHDHELEDQLTARLHAETSTITPSADLAAILRRRHSRRQHAMRVAVAVPVVAAIGVAASLTLATPGTQPSAGPSSVSAPVLDITLVSARTAAALANVSDYVQHSHEVRNDGVTTDSWIDDNAKRERHDEYDAQGTLKYSSTLMGVGKLSIVVDYANRAWWNDQIAHAMVSPGQDRTGMIDGPIYDPAVIKDAEDSGTLQLVGPETIDGHATLHLRWSTIPGFTLDLWIDASTYLPLRHTALGAKGGSTVEYSWLPRTPENLGKLDVTPPAGFTKTKPEDPRD